MKLGIVSDIHEAVELLEVALRRFEREGVDRVVVLGDVFETGHRIAEAVNLLVQAQAVGVFGNHDYGLSVEPREDITAQFAPETLGFMTSLQPRMEIDGCLFAHREPWLDGSNLLEIWHVDEEPMTPDLIALSFDVAPHRAIFVGHFHRWLATTRTELLGWDGSSSIKLDPRIPTLVIVNAVCEGYAATFDTESGLLEPLELYEPGQRPLTRPLPRWLEMAKPREPGAAP